MTNNLSRLTPRLKSLQHNTLQPENGPAHGICWQNNTVEHEHNNTITTCIFGWWKALWLQFCEKPIFSYNKGIYFNLTIMVVETSLRRYNPNSIPIKVINSPTILVKSDEIHVNTQVLDSQNCP